MRGLIRRGVVTVAAAVLAAAGVLAGAGPAAAQPTVLYAAVTATGSGDCSAAADACTLSTALGDVTAGGVIELVTAGSTARYVGNWTVGTPGTSATAPVTIEAAPGLTGQPVLDGDGPNAPAGETCSTSSCDGPVLTVPGGEFAALSAITIADGNNTGPGGGGLDNHGTVTITGCTFIGNFAIVDGGAIDSGDGFNGGTGGGSVTVTASTFTGNTANDDGGAIDSGDHGGDGSVTVTASTFTGNTTKNDGGAIDSGDDLGGGSVTVAASTFSGDTARRDGGAIDSGDQFGGGSVRVTASTFTGNTAEGGGAIDSGDNGGGTVTVAASTFSGNTASLDGGAIDSGDFGGGGSVTVAASTFSGNTASGDGGAIDSGDHGPSTGSAQVAGDVFDGSCLQPGSGSWDDGGYNAGSDSSCFSPSPAPGDVNAGSGAALQLGPLADNGGPTQTIKPGPGSPVTAIVPDPASVTLGGSPVALCPAADQRGYTSAAGTGCDAGAVQTSGRPPALTLADSATPASFNQAGQVITYHYQVRNTGAGTVGGITITDPAVPAASCPHPSLAPGSAETCTGTHTITRADLAAGKITDTATASGAATTGVPVTSRAATLTLHRGWPPAVSGTRQPAAHAAQGYYLGVTGSTWSLTATHPGTGKVIFTGTVTLNAGAFRNLTPVHLDPGDTFQVNRKTLTFRFTNYGDLDGLRFATTPADTAITFTLDIGGHPATASQLYLGRAPTHPRHGSPLTFTR